MLARGAREELGAVCKWPFTGDHSRLQTGFHRVPSSATHVTMGTMFLVPYADPDLVGCFWQASVLWCPQGSGHGLRRSRGRFGRTAISRYAGGAITSLRQASAGTA